KVEFYTAKELQDRKLTIVDKDDCKERYAHALLGAAVLLGKVQVTGSGHGVETIGKESLIVAFKLDPQFDKDQDFPNEYQTAKPNPAGVVVLGSKEPYSGFGGYVKITKLQGDEPRIFVEYHLAYDEPHDWFDGGNNLISKLSIGYRDDVRNFRRRVL